MVVVVIVVIVVVNCCCSGDSGGCDVDGGADSVVMVMVVVAQMVVMLIVVMVMVVAMMVVMVMVVAMMAVKVLVVTRARLGCRVIGAMGYDRRHDHRGLMKTVGLPLSFEAGLKVPRTTATVGQMCFGCLPEEVYLCFRAFLGCSSAFYCPY